MAKGRSDVSTVMDSGAFSAWTKQEKIDVRDYGKFILKHLDDFDLIINLDVIPGKWGQKSVPKKEMIDAIEEGWDNYYTLIDMGVPKERIIHVFHQGEPFEYLERMMNEMDYLGISPANDRTTAEKKVWLDKCKAVVAPKGKPLVKTHGFGMTSLNLIWRFPFFSIDSTTWVLAGAMGGVIIPKKKFGRYVYTETPITIPITIKDGKKVRDKKHFANLSDIEKSAIIRYMKERGFTPEEIRDDGLKRDRINARFFLDLEKALNVRVYLAGNFPMLHKIEREFETMDYCLQTTDQYKRLGSYYHEKYLLKLIEVKRRT